MSTMKNPNPSSTKALFSHIKYEHLVAGISGGVTSTLILHPLDLIKIRFAVNDGRTATVPRYDGLSSAFVTIVKKEGVKGLYRGVTPNVWGSGSAWGFYFLFYNAIKTWIQGGNARTPLGPGLHMLAAAEAGVLSLVMTNPIWVVKTRLCLQYSEESLTDNKRYKGMIDGLMKIYRTEGIRGLYRSSLSNKQVHAEANTSIADQTPLQSFPCDDSKIFRPSHDYEIPGFVPGMFGVSHGALQFMTYEEMKNRYNQYRNLPIDIKLTSVEYLTFAAISKLIAAGATYPYQVVRARLQDQHRTYDGAWHCINETWRHEGWRGFYKGLKPNIIRVLPATMITFLTYENVSHYMLNRSREMKLPS